MTEKSPQTFDQVLIPPRITWISQIKPGWAQKVSLRSYFRLIRAFRRPTTLSLRVRGLSKIGNPGYGSISRIFASKKRAKGCVNRPVELTKSTNCGGATRQDSSPPD